MKDRVTCGNCGEYEDGCDCDGVAIAGQWIKPVMEGYQMECCDCGLIHKLDFKVVEITREHKDGTKDYEDAPEKYEVMLKAERLNPAPS